LNKSIDPRLGIAVAAAKLTTFGLRRTGRGGGTAAPGLVAEFVDPGILRKVGERLRRGVVVVAGTNGKTTTSRMIADVLEADGLRVIHNRSGSNLVRGVAAAFAGQSSWRGQPEGDVAVVETDEAAFSAIVERVRPSVVLLNNLFRDQLDRYGELDAIARQWSSALEQLPATTTVVVNADDPVLAEITHGIAARRITFGLDERFYMLDRLPHAADSGVCRRCGADLDYSALYVSHLGAWRCPQCGAERPALDICGREIRLVDVESLEMTVARAGAEPVRVCAGVPGMYNAYNVLATTAVAEALGIDSAVVQAAMAEFRSAFGRIERIEIAGRTITLALVKNPVGFNEVLRMLTMATNGLSVPTMIVINDRHADGRDVSWLWDVDFELLSGGSAPLTTAGIRGSDMTNRLKYAGVPANRIQSLEPHPGAAIDLFVAGIPEGGRGYILATYTAMLDLRANLAERGAVERFWEQ
jgi:lipid II isoglutaminyl synthase (glutamine-hydrolysing)